MGRRHQVKQVAGGLRRVAAAILRPPLGDDGSDQRRPALAEAAAAPRQRRRHAGRQQEVARRGPADRRHVARHHRPQLGAEGGGLEREHGRRRDLEAEALHLREQVDRTRPGRQPGAGDLGAADDVRGQHRHRARREGRRHDPALVAPRLALAGQQAAPDDRAEDAPTGRQAPEILGAGLQDVAHRLRRARQDEGAAGHAQAHHRFGEAARRERGEPVAAQGREHAQAADPVVRDRRHRRHEQSRVGGHFSRLVTHQPPPGPWRRRSGCRG